MVEGVPENEVQKAVDICTKLAELSISLKDNEQAIYYYKDALNVAPKDINTMAKLAQLYMQVFMLLLTHQFKVRLQNNGLVGGAPCSHPTYTNVARNSNLKC